MSWTVKEKRKLRERDEITREKVSLSVEPSRKDPNRGMRFLKSKYIGWTDPINVGKLGIILGLLLKKGI